MTKFFYADPHGNVRDNDTVLPLDLLKSKHVDGTIFRFAIDTEHGKFYIQDKSFKDRISSGDKDSWHFLNECLRFSKGKFGKAMFDREYGEPPDDVTRKLSDYPESWRVLSKLLEDFESSPPEIPVIEFVQDDGKSDKLVSLSHNSIRLNRLAKSHLGREGDIEHSLLDNILQCFYLSKIENLMSGNKTFSKHWDNHKCGTPTRWFALFDGEKTQVFDDKGISERELRGIDGTLIAFTYLPKQKRIVFLDHSPLGLPDETVCTIKKFIASHSNIPSKDLILSFDPALSVPFVSTLKRYRIPWQLISEEADGSADLNVVEVPLDVVNGAKIIGSSKNERDVVPGSIEYRVGHGLNVNYPFLLVDNRVSKHGRKLRNIMKEVLNSLGKPSKNLSLGIEEMLNALERAEQPERYAELKKKISFLIGMGLEKDDVIDFMVDPEDLFLRSLYNKAIGEIGDEFDKRARKNACIRWSKTAEIGPTYDVNSWWHIGLQEELNRAQHEEPAKKKSVESPPQKKQEPPSYSKMLGKDHDKNLSYMKSIEQLLRESQV